ncbi:hypothetical protein NW755_013293 [Fusarium falciforme]|uniref:Uncharacterized protein n=1 Tax=Fusarium falciforme TaxID=195108 RepID=A0A9W8QW55_9HYPO|nr:hypothetical protein NW755_013293 [Fusarium falciforme]
MANHPSPPEYVIRVLSSVPRALPPYLYKGQTILLLCIDKFVKGFYDSQAGIESLSKPNQSGDYNMMLEEWEWQVLRTRCQAVSTLVRKHEAIPNPTNERPVALNRPERAETLKVIMGNLLHDKVFKKAQDPASFLSSYRKGLEETEKRFGHSHDYTINLLCNYTSAAYYIFHDNGLANELAIRLWERTSSACGNDETPLSWSVKAQGMAEAAKMLALLCCITHENKRKSGGEMKKLRRKLKLKGRKARKRFRATLQSPPDPQNAKQAIENLEKTVERLDASEWDCKFVKAGLLDTLGNLTQEFCPKEVQGGAAKSHREEATGIRLEIVRNDQGEKQ